MEEGFKQKISSILIGEGWVPVRVSDPEEEDLYLYEKAYPNATIQIEIALDETQLGGYGWYGVCCVQVSRWYESMPYLVDDLIGMLNAISAAETELLKLKVPFRPTYAFSGHGLESKLGENLELRDLYQLHELERRAGWHDSE